MVRKVLSFRALFRNASWIFCASFSMGVLWPGLGSLFWMIRLCSGCSGCSMFIIAQLSERPAAGNTRANSLHPPDCPVVEQPIELACSQRAAGRIRGAVVLLDR